jgi:hypothetical protein
MVEKNGIETRQIESHVAASIKLVSGITMLGPNRAGKTLNNRHSTVFAHSIPRLTCGCSLLQKHKIRTKNGNNHQGNKYVYFFIPLVQLL